MADRSSWQWQLAHSIRTLAGLERLLAVSSDEREGIWRSPFPWRITPYYAGLMDPEDPRCPIRQQAVPTVHEVAEPLDSLDPLEEEARSPVPGLIRRYPDRVAWCVSSTCAVLCRHCYRKRRVGTDDGGPKADRMEEALAFIRRDRQIRDVLVTGGDPLILGDAVIGSILERVRAIDHVQIIRIGTRTPVTLPHRITRDLCRLLKRFHPLWINTQFNHPKEVTPLSAEACMRLADAGIPLGNQAVLLKGINDEGTIMRRLGEELVRIRVRPYYLFQCHPVRGTAHFRSRIESGMAIVDELRGTTSGFAIPAFVVDTPAGKIPVQRSAIVEQARDAVYLRTKEGSVWREPDPAP